MSKPTPPELRFAADVMLGRLAKWLRVLGQDVIYGRHLSGAGLTHAARQENRIILTRDRRLHLKPSHDSLFIESDDFRQQLRQVVSTFHLVQSQDLFNRCLICNYSLHPRPKASVKQAVPEYVFSTQEHFFWCANCRRIYWPGTHHQKMLQELNNLQLK
ncbi:MAG TPA: Mut7-C RNAse domain-containing protein [Candidatus Binatia bacterium]